MSEELMINLEQESSPLGSTLGLSASTPPCTKEKGDKRKSLRWHARGWLLTYAQSKLTREVVQQHLESLAPVKELLICQEKHQDGNVHYHALVVYSQQIDSTNVRYWDIQGEHPNVRVLGRGAGNFKRAAKYCLKEDTAPIVVGFDIADLDAKKGEGEYGKMVTSIVGGAQVQTIMEQFPKSYMRYKRNVREFIQEIEIEKKRKMTKPWPKIKCDNYPEIAEWLNDHIRMPRDNPLPQLWITGPPGVGKSCMKEFLEQYLNVYDVPKCGNDNYWLDGYQNDYYDLIAIDEFRDRNYTYTKLNILADGKRYDFPTKGSHIRKEDKVPMIILSNWSISNSYVRIREQNPYIDGALRRRFKEIYLEEDKPLRLEAIEEEKEKEKEKEQEN